VVTTEQRRQVVTYLRAAYSVSARRACRLVGLARSRWQYVSRRPARDALRERLKALAGERPRWGYKRLHVLLRREGHAVNHKLVYRLYRAEQLFVRRRRRKRVAGPRAPITRPTRPNERWGMDFIQDAFVEGRRFRCLTMVDEFTRECPSITVDCSLPAARVIAALTALAATRGLPASLVVDHGPEFISKALDAWAFTHGVQLEFIRPGKPVDNAYIESFHSRFRDECLNERWFWDLPDAQRQIEAWRQDYNEVRPHESLQHRTPKEFAEAFTHLGVTAALPTSNLTGPALG
jgi:putative transposase